MRLYLAGPMRGYPEFNHPAFAEGTRLLRGLGHDVFSPAENNLRLGLDPAGMSGDQAEVERKFPLRACLAADVAWICGSAEGIALLDGWETSGGARAEVALALALGLPVWELRGFTRDGGSTRVTMLPCLTCGYPPARRSQDKCR